MEKYLKNNQIPSIDMKFDDVICDTGSVFMKSSSLECTLQLKSRKLTAKVSYHAVYAFCLVTQNTEMVHLVSATSQTKHVNFLH